MANCKGLDTAKGYGCGKPVEGGKRKKGLGIYCCYSGWLLGTPEGKQELEKARIKGSTKLKTTQRAATKKALEELRTKSDWEKHLQQEVNKIVRLIDRDTFCISSLKPLNDKFDAGHYYSCGSNPAIRFNLLNIYAQSVHDNRHKGGNPISFMENLNLVYGKEVAEMVTGLKLHYPLLKLSKDELKEKITIARKIVCDLKKLDAVYPEPSERIRLRFKYNEMIGIYKI